METGEQYNDKVLRDFKLVVRHQILLLRKAAGAHTAYFYWINRRREQFVMESRSTKHTNVIFQDRISFDQHFLQDFKDISEVKTVEVGPDQAIDPSSLTHYYKTTPVEQLLLIPLKHNQETVALTILEYDHQADEKDRKSVVEAYTDGLNNMMETYMEFNNLNEGEHQWRVYEEEVTALLNQDSSADPFELILRLAESLNQYLSRGGVVLLVPSGDSWITLFNSRTQPDDDLIIPGLTMEKGSIAEECLDKGDTVYLSHLNGSPKRISHREPEHTGATLAVPLKLERKVNAIILTYDTNPLVFKHSAMHKLINMMRLVTQQVRIELCESDIQDPFLDSDTQLIRKTVWKQVTEKYLNEAASTNFQLGMGVIQIQNIQSIRTKLRLEQLNQLKYKLIERIHPSNLEVPGLLGNYQEYKYVIIIPVIHEDSLSDFERLLQRKMEDPFQIEGEDELTLELDIRLSSFSNKEEITNTEELINSL